MTHWAYDYIGLPFKSGGRTPKGFDCWGLIVWIQQHHFNRTLPSIPVDPDCLKQVADSFQRHPERKRWHFVDNAVNGDLLLLKQATYPIHVGIWLTISKTEQGVLHCIKNSGVVFQNIASLHLSGWQIDGAYRLFKHEVQNGTNYHCL